MASSRLADLSQASEAGQSSYLDTLGRGGGAEKENTMRPTLNNPSYKYGNQTRLIAGTFGKQLTIGPTKN